MMSENILYQDDHALVSNARVVIGPKTYALRNITSVSTREIPPNNNVGALLIILGLFIVGIHLMVTLSSAGGKVDPSFVFISLVLIGAGAYQFFTAKTNYVILFSTSGNEIHVMASLSKERITNIANAVNNAIIHQA